MHTHPGSEKPGDSFDEELLRRHLTDHRDAGVLAVRTPGSAARIPDWAYDDSDLPTNLDPGLLDRMAAQGTALVPTLTAFAQSAETIRTADPSPRRERWLRAWEGMFHTVRAAHEAGVTILASTHSLPFGTVAGEVQLLVQAGLPAEVALGAACWTARSLLGLSSLSDGAPADLLVYDTDPTLDPEVLAHPSRIISRGKVIR